MKNSNLITILILVILSILVAILAQNVVLKSFLLIVFVIKFLLVAFNFMEMKYAHTFWKVLIIIFITGLFSTIMIMKGGN